MAKVRSFLCLLCLSLIVPLYGCSTEQDLSSRKLNLRTLDHVEVLSFETGAEVETTPQSREAVLVILDGVWPSNGQLHAKLSHVVEADTYVAHNAFEGDPHWITRAQVRDSDGEVLWSQRVNSLFQLLEFLNLLLEQQDQVNFTPEQVFRLVESQYPELLQFAVKVPTGIDGGVTYVLDFIDEDGTWTEVASYSIADLVAQAQPPSVQGEVVDLVANGHEADRLNVVILGDGYTANQRHLFDNDAQAVAQRFMQTSPMAEHADLFNIKSIWTPSQESGAGYDCNHFNAPANCEQTFRDTVFETVFVIPAIEDRFGMPLGDVSDRVAMPIQIGRVFEVAAQGSYDEIILLSNSRKRSGFAGLYISLVTTFDSGQNFPDVAVHEVGHTLGLLGDEYTVAGDPCYFNEPRVPLPANIGQLINGEIKWSEWVASGTPLPTPASQASQHQVGAYEGAYNCDFLVRPSHTCMMNRSGDDFCPVCAEQMVRRFYAMVDPAPHEPARAVRVGDGQARLRVPLRSQEDRYEVTWTIAGLIESRGRVFSVDAEALQHLPSGQWLPVEATVHNSSPFIHTRDASVESTFSFEIMLEE